MTGSDDDPAPVFDTWAAAAFDAPERDTYPPALLEREQWMGRQGKLPFSPWGDPDADLPCKKNTCPAHTREEDAETTAACEACQYHQRADPPTTARCNHDARYKWGDDGHHADGETVARAERAHPEIDGCVFIQQESDPFAFVDGDKVIDPDTGAPHPAFLAVLEHLGGTNSDVSQSDTGAHAIYRGALPDGVKQASWVLDDEPWRANDDPPTVEIYDGKHVNVTTGKHVPGTPLEVCAWDDDALRALLDANDELPEDDDSPVSHEHDTDRDRADLADYTPEATTADEQTGDVRDVLAAIDDLEPDDLPLNTRQVGYDSTGWEQWDPSTYRPSAGGDSLHRPPDDPVFHDHKTGESFGVLGLFAAEQGIITDPWDPLTGDDWWAAVDAARDAGAPIPEYNPADTPGSTRGGHHSVERCAPPLATDTATDFDAPQRWAALQGDRYDQYIDADGPVIEKDPPGSGKTTNAELAALERDRPTATLFDKHEKAREVVTDDALPDDFDPFHLKGGTQKRHPHCMDADHAGEPCPDHGANDACPSMCPVYDLPEDSDIRQCYDVLARELKHIRAHLILGDALPGHDADGYCPWRQGLDNAEHADHIVGVHEYQVLKTVRDGRDVIIDEAPRSLRDERRVTVEGLIRTANALEDLADAERRDDPVAHTARDVARFVRALADAVGGGETPLADLEPPAPVWSAWQAKNSAAGNYVDTEPADEDWQVGEALAQLKLAFNRLLVNRVRRDEWNGTPFCMDAVLASAAEAGLPTDAVMQAVALPALLEHCPWCGSDLTHDAGAQCCGSDDCDWHERDHTVLQTDSEQARARASLATDADDIVVALRYESLPLVSDLPDNPLILDATATPSKIAALYGVDRDDVLVTGDDDLAANMRVTQVHDGQYHASTIKNSDTARERIQQVINTTSTVYERPLYLVKKGLKPLFDFPEHGEVLHYHATRGLNRAECDGVTCIGAPHPNVDDLQREAELLAMGRNDVRVGGDEYSTRRDAPNPPVYRKLRYTDDDGQGRAVPTKHYSGLVGDLFRETRENELEQAVHRARPLLADPDDSVDVYLLTNVPTNLPIDEVCTFADLADPLDAMLPVPDAALEFLDVVADVGAGNAPDGFRADALIDARDGTIKEKVATYHRLAHLSGRDDLQVTERTVRNWITALEDLGLLTATVYEQREGRRYTAELATLKSALSSLSGNGGFEVAAVRRFRALAAAADGSLEWLRWAREAFGLPVGASIKEDPPPNAAD